jgi:sec-independent protein translocase protein TatB
MFDIAFTELMIAAVIALLIVGPQRLPKMARQIGAWAGKLQRYVNDVKADINRQIQMDELRNLKTEVTDAAQSLEASVKKTMQETEKEFDDLSTSLQSDLLDDEPEQTAPTDWKQVYETRRIREKIRERRENRLDRLGKKRPTRRF